MTKILALFLPQLALFVFAVALLFTHYRWLGIAIIAVLVGSLVFALAVGLAGSGTSKTRVSR
jgi:hypothetical protein